MATKGDKNDGETQKPTGIGNTEAILISTTEKRVTEPGKIPSRKVSTEVAAILDDPATNQWLKKKKAAPVDQGNTEGSQSGATKMERGNEDDQAAQRILDNPDTLAWIGKEKAAKPADVDVEAILNDPDNRDWLTKRSMAPAGYGNQGKNPTGATEVERLMEYAATDSEDVNPELEARPPQLGRQNPASRIHSQPGAYSAEQEGLHRRDAVDFSAVVGHSEQLEGPSNGQSGVQAVGSTNNGNLAEAVPVLDEALPDTEAQVFDLEADAERKLKRKKKQRLSLCMMALCILICAAIVLTFTLKTKQEDPSSSLPRDPSEAPSMPPSQIPSLAPTRPLDLFLENLPKYTLESLRNSSTPQWQAKAWLENHPELQGMPEWRKRQLFALVTFYYAMDGANWPEAIRQNWLTDSDECYWFDSLGGEFNAIGSWEVNEDELHPKICNEEGERQLLALQNLGLGNSNPHVPPEIALLTSLSTLLLSKNNIIGSLDNFLPPQLYQMSNVAKVDLSGNSFSGQIPNQLGLMTNLQDLQLIANKLSGSIPSELGLLSNLEILLIHENFLTGPIPSQLGLATSLVSLWMFANALTGSLPTEIGRLADITEMTANAQSLSGPIPSQLGLMSRLGFLSLWGNWLTGSIASEIGKLSSLEFFWVSSNFLFGSLPSELGLMTRISDCFCPYLNRLTGSLPSELAMMTNATGLVVKGNLLSGQLPSEIGLMTSLTELRIQTNNMSGFLPSEIGQLAALKDLDIYDNNFFGTIPSELGLMLGLEQARLRNNSFTGSIPRTLDLLASNGSLFTLQIQNNMFSGTVKEELCALRLFNPDVIAGLAFDCNDQLCGCCWCYCEGINTPSFNGSGCPVAVSTDKYWPGLFPKPDNASNSIAINIRTDEFPDETSWLWSIQLKDGSWDDLNFGRTPNATSLHTVTKDIQPDSIYRLRIMDSGDDGACCRFGTGWFSITNSTPSNEFVDGSLVWNALGSGFGSALDVLIYVGISGDVQLVEQESSIDYGDDWPGLFPTASNTSASIAVNIHSDDYPGETTWTWSIESEEAAWEDLESGTLQNLRAVHSATFLVESNSIYRLRVTDSQGDGICCGFGIGWCTITNSTPSKDFLDGTLIWEARGDGFHSSFDVILSVDLLGKTQFVEFLSE